ncbi:MAG TPA: hypothetical protein VMM79_18020 [Longimicrobiales bacterium]|nr:hypothetical protein [Longimicrobiales bacterium]
MRITLVLAGLVLAAACDEGGPTTPDPADPGGGDGPGDETPAIGLSVSAGTLTLNQGESGEIAVVLTRSGVFAGEISLAVEGLPSGVTAVFAPAIVPVGGSASAITLSAGGSASPGGHTLTLRARGQGVETKAVTLTLTVVEVTVPGFTLSVADPTITIAQGTGLSTSVSVARVGGFTGAVTLSIAGTPPGLNATLTPSFVGTEPATLAVGATFNGPLGTHVLTITATGQNVALQTATVTVVVTSSNPTGEVAWQFCPASGIPVWFAFQDGMANPWIRVTGVNDIFVFDMVASRGGVAYARQTATGGYRVDVSYGTPDEPNTLGQRLCAGSRAGRTVHGQVAGLSADEQAWISFGDASAVVPANSAFSLQNVLGGTFDLLASAISVGAGGASSLDALILRRALDPANGGSLVTLDFSGQEAFAPVGQSATVGNLGTDQTRLTMAYHARGRTATYYSDASPVASSTRVFPAIPGSRQVAGDMHLLTLLAAPAGATASSPYRTATAVFRVASNQTVSLGPSLSPVSVTVPSSVPYARLQASYPVQTHYATFWTFEYGQAGPAGLDREVVISATGTYFTTFSTITLALPEFAGTGGWNVAYGPRAGIPTEWTFTASGWPEAGGLDGPPLLDGAQGLTATRGGSITP